MTATKSRHERLVHGATCAVLSPNTRQPAQMAAVQKGSPMGSLADLSAIASPFVVSLTVG